MALAQTFLGFLSSTSDLTTYSLGTVSPASSGLLVVIALSRSGSSITITDISIGGVSSTLVVTGAADQNPGAMGALVVTAGTHAISVTHSAGAVRCGAACYLLTGYNSATPVSTSVNTGGIGLTSSALALDYPAAGGIGLYGAIHTNTNAHSWSAATSDHDTSVEAVVRMGSAHKTASGAGDSETVSWTTSATRTFLGAVWEPSAGGGGNRRRRSLICGAA